MWQMGISARAACKKYKIDPEVYGDRIAEMVNSTNGAYASISGGINRSNVAHYSRLVARGIKAMIDRGDTPDPDKLTFAECCDAGNATILDFL